MVVNVVNKGDYGCKEDFSAYNFEVSFIFTVYVSSVTFSMECMIFFSALLILFAVFLKLSVGEGGSYDIYIYSHYKNIYQSRHLKF